MKIDVNEVKFIGPDRDEVGRVFFWNDRFFRAVRPESSDNVRQLLHCGLLDELAENNLFPGTFETDYKLDGYAFILEHQKIQNLTYLYEWSFSMLKDASITILKVYLTAGKYGYQIKDGHAFNIMFHYTKPMFVDLGSFVKKTDVDVAGWFCEEFTRHLYYPLRIWADGNNYIARRILSHTNEYIPHYAYFLYKYPFFRLFNERYLSLLLNYWFGFRRISLYNSEMIKNMIPGLKGRIAAYLKDKNLLPFQQRNINSILDQVSKISPKQYQTTWGSYHDQFQKTKSSLTSTPRFDRIIEIIKSHNIRSVFEIGGNQGHFSCLIKERTDAENIICSDYDENAVEMMYLNAKKNNIDLTPVLMDFMYPTCINNDATPYERFKSDAVIALAITHHLILSQRIPVDLIFQELSKYTGRYVFVEFMPLGLWSKDSAPPVPDWYTVDWFENSFIKYFKIISKEHIEKNRILFFGEVLK